MEAFQRTNSIQQRGLPAVGDAFSSYWRQVSKAIEKGQGTISRSALGSRRSECWISRIILGYSRNRLGALCIVRICC